MLDGAARIGDLVDEVARLEMPAIAMTDHGNVLAPLIFISKPPRPGLNQSSASKPMLHQNHATIKNVCNGQMGEMMMSLVVAHIRT